MGKKSTKKKAAKKAAAAATPPGNANPSNPPPSSPEHPRHRPLHPRHAAAARIAKKIIEAAKKPAAPKIPPLELPADRAERLGQVPASELTHEGVATHRVDIAVYAFSEAQAQRMARRITEMFTGSETKVCEIKREKSAAAASAPEPTSTETAAPAVVTGESPVASETKPATKTDTRSLFRDKENPLCIVEIVSTQEHTLTVRDIEKGNSWEVERLTFAKFYDRDEPDNSYRK